MSSGHHNPVPFDDATLQTLLTGLLPSLDASYLHRHNGILSVRFRSLDDFICMTIAAGSANIACEVHNTFEDKLVLPRRIASCMVTMRLASNFDDERLVWFFSELLMLRHADGLISKESLAVLSVQVDRVDAGCHAGDDI